MYQSIKVPVLSMEIINPKMQSNKLPNCSQQISWPLHIHPCDGAPGCKPGCEPHCEPRREALPAAAATTYNIESRGKTYQWYTLL